MVPSLTVSPEIQLAVEYLKILMHEGSITDRCNIAVQEARSQTAANFNSPNPPSRLKQGHVGTVDQDK